MLVFKTEKRGTKINPFKRYCEEPEIQKDLAHATIGHGRKSIEFGFLEDSQFSEPKQ